MELWDVYDCNRIKTGHTHERGKPMTAGDYRLVVVIWVLNSKGQFLVTKRTPNKMVSNLWEPTGGSAVTGDTSLDAALREVKEETGLTLELTNGQVILPYRRDEWDNTGFKDVWLFKEDFDISEVVLQEGEACDAKWATQKEIRSMIDTGEFVPVFDYIEKVFDSGIKADERKQFENTENRLT